MAGIKKKASADQLQKTRAELYQAALRIDGQLLPDPLSDVITGWIGEEKGIPIPGQ